MKLKLISMYDKKLGVYSNPSYERDVSNEDLIEGYRRMCANPKLPVGYFDFDVYILGYYDDKTGEFDTHKPEFLVALGDFRHLAAVKEEKQDVKSA